MGSFAKGGCGCIIAFFVIGLITVAAGGSVYIDAGGLSLLFLMGGLVGLAIFGSKSAHPDQAVPRESSSTQWLCPSCGVTNPTGSSACGQCEEPCPHVRPGITAREEDPGAAWVCPCNFTNVGGKACQSCGWPRGEDVD